jgi:L-malate glycosyltransferase
MITMKKNVLIIDNSSGWTGAFKSVVTVARKLSPRYNFHFCIPKNSANAPFLIEKGFSFIKMNFIEISKRLNVVLYLPRLISNAYRVKKYCRNHQIEIVHVNDLYNLLGVILKIISPDIKIVYHIRLLESSYARSFYKYWIKIISRYANHLITVSQAAKKDAAQYTEKSLNVIYDCIDVTPIKLPSPNNDYTSFLYLANYTPGKGHDVAIEAFAEAFKENQSMKLIIAGGTLGIDKNEIYKKELQGLVEEKSLTSAISLRDFESNVQQAMEQCDVFLNFSKSESFSMTCLEAITFGKPVITTSSGGPAEIITQDYCGFVIPIGHVSAAAEAMLQLANDAYKRDYFSSNAVQQAGEKFNLDREAAKLSNLYEA